MAKTKIVNIPPTSQRHFPTTGKNTDMSQRETLEEIIINLSSSLGVSKIHKQENARGSYFYEVQASGLKGFQSASNTILELSRRIVRSRKD